MSHNEASSHHGCGDDCSHDHSQNLIDKIMKPLEKIYEMITD
jgi:hypothetical protein